MADGGKVIDGLDDVIHLNRLEGCADLIGAVHLLNLVSCQPVTGHTVDGIAVAVFYIPRYPLNQA